MTRVRQGGWPPADFFLAPTADVARGLLGCRLVRGLPGGRTRTLVIVETEAYLGVIDRAAHTWNGRITPRVAPMWGPAGHAYVYRIYGLHDCLNVVTQREGVPEAVLIRAGVPEAWWAGRAEVPGILDASGPGKLCRALGITTALSGISLRSPQLRLLLPRAGRDFDVESGPRVGVAYAQAASLWPLRFAVAGCPAVTRPRGLSRVAGVRVTASGSGRPPGASRRPGRPRLPGTG